MKWKGIIRVPRGYAFDVEADTEEKAIEEAIDDWELREGIRVDRRTVEVVTISPVLEEAS